MHVNDFSVLVTRPVHLAKPLIDALKDIGARVYHFPTLNIKYLSDDKTVQQVIKQFTQYQWHIFVSRNAVKAVLPSIIKAWSSQDLVTLHWAAVGKSTAEELAHFIKVDIVYPQEGQGANALCHELEDKIKTSDTVVEWCGDNPTSVWPSAKQVMCYQREKNQIPFEYPKHVDYVIVTSGTSMECLEMEKLQHSKLIVISERLIELAKNQGFKGKIILAKGADTASLINAIKGDLI